MNSLAKFERNFAEVHVYLTQENLQKQEFGSCGSKLDDDELRSHQHINALSLVLECRMTHGPFLYVYVL